MPISVTSGQLKRLRLRAAARKRDQPTRGEGIEPPRSVEASYFRSLRALIRRLEQRVKREIFPLLERFESEYIADSPYSIQQMLSAAVTDLKQMPVMLEREQRRIATRLASGVETFNRTKFLADLHRILGVSLRGIITREGVARQIEDSIADNIALIKSIPEQYHERLREAINTGINRGDNAFSIRKQILELGQSTAKRAKFIARDQTAKLNAAVTQARQTRLGVTHYFWRTSRDERVRPSHEAKEGERFAWDSPPADTGHPGQDYQCRCSADPDLSGVLDMVGAPELERITPPKLTEVKKKRRRKKKKK